ncbi:transposase family protein, partial [Streptomyces sp. 8L]|uniref:transposase family protein n=1 Tax=Streptomyces sp. 8L TaxID=2877242 RepID=UPI001CD7583C
MSVSLGTSPCSLTGAVGEAPADGLLQALAKVPDPRDRRGVRYRLATLLAIGVCAMTGAGRNSLVAIAEWARRCDQEVPARLGCPFDPFAGRYRAPGERTLRDAFAKVDPGALTATGFARFTALASSAAGRLSPDGVPEREQRCAHRAAVLAPEPARLRRRAFAVDGKCLRGAVRADGTRMFVLTAVLREIGAKTNEIPEFAPLLDAFDDADLREAVITVDAIHAQKEHARYLVEDRHAHYLLSVKNNQPTLASQLRKLPWGKAPVLDRSRDRGHGREEAGSVARSLFVRVHPVRPRAIRGLRQSR